MTVRWILMVAALSVSVACGYAPVNRQAGQSCQSSTDCIGDLVCSYGTCEAPSVGSSSSCSPACGSGQVCVKDNSSLVCVDTCSSNADCATCCASTTTGTPVCAPSLSYCGGAGGGGGATNDCPPGTYRLQTGGPCVSEPSTCPNDWVVCNCPETHGEWCHPACKYPLNCGGTSNPSYPCGSSSTGGGSGGGSGSTTGTLTVWAGRDFGCGSVSVTAGSSTAVVSQYYAGEPACGASGCANFTLSPGSYAVSAQCSSRSWGPSSISVSAGACSMIELR